MYIAIMELNRTILAAIDQACTKAGSPADFARITGVSQSQLSRYMTGEIKRVQDETWRKLVPHLKEFLPPGAGDWTLAPVGFPQANEFLRRRPSLFRPSPPPQEPGATDPLLPLGDAERRVVLAMRMATDAGRGLILDAARAAATEALQQPKPEADKH